MADQGFPFTTPPLARIRGTCREDTKTVWRCSQMKPWWS